jgi:double-stranded uracil-DNA glycosylase
MASNSSRVFSFPPQIGDDCRVLILGTVPSIRSLELHQSYAHAQNFFWPLMGEMFNAGPELPYAERIARLHRHGVGIWDVLKHCERPGSLDSSIVPSSEVPNDIPDLLRRQSSIRAIALNGGKAQQAFKRHLLPQMDQSLRDRITLLMLPSTSPANASIPREEKRRRWAEIKSWTK